jgi:hypothetical protein
MKEDDDMDDAVLQESLRMSNDGYVVDTRDRSFHTLK